LLEALQFDDRQGDSQSLGRVDWEAALIRQPRPPSPLPGLVASRGPLRQQVDTANEAPAPPGELHCGCTLQGKSDGSQRRENVLTGR